MKVADCGVHASAVFLVISGQSSNMPEIKVQHVVSFSSEDKAYPADNLLKAEGTSKWKSATVGEKNVTCTLQLEKAVKISQIDIGNESSAFVEVLAGRTSDTESEYKVILVASSFMSPSESRTSQNVNRVRLFSEDKLSKAATEEKWDRVKVVCSQPFNKSVKYGLSFFKLHSPSDGKEPEAPKPATLGGFKIKAETDSGSDLKAGSLFASRHKESPSPSTPLSGAAAVRAAARAADASPKTKPVERERVQDKTPEAESSSSSKPLKRKHTSSPTEETETKHQAKLHRQSQSTGSTHSHTSSKQPAPAPLKKAKSDPSSRAGGGGGGGGVKVFSKLMSKVVFVMSGYQNPERGKIRDKALEMGAVYKPDWADNCTHLICAFAKTPKYNAVKSKGRIVSKDWILQCYRKERLLPWRNFRVGDAPSPPTSEEDEMSGEESLPHKKMDKPSQGSRVKATRVESPPVASSSKSKVVDPDDPAFYAGSTDEEMDTDDEIERVKVSQANHSKPVKEEAAAILDDSTEDEDSGDDENVMDNLPQLPDFFKGKRFLLYGDKIAAKERRSLLRYIIAYNGKLEEYMNDKVQFVLSNDAWDNNFEEALCSFPNLFFVKPAWIFACDDKQKLLPHQRYVIVPPA